MSTNFLGPHNLMGFVACCIFTGCKSNGKTHPFHGKSMGTNFPALFHLMGFADFSNGMQNSMRKHMHFPCDEVYHRIGI